MDNRIIFTIIGAAIATAVILIFFWPSIEERTETTYTTDTKIDWIKKDTTIIHYRDSLILKEVEAEREVSPDPEKYDSIRTYQGFERHLYGRINWKAKTGGYLQHLEINPVLTIPIQTVTNTIE